MMGRKERVCGPLPPLTLEELVPPDHFYRHLERTLDLGFVRTLIQDLLMAEHEGWESAQTRLHDLQWWCTIQSERLASLTYEQKRLALFARHVEATVWSKDHDPRFAITMQIDLDNPLSDPHSAGDAALFEAHVGASIRRGCARRDGRRGDPL
jgi:hypothetical protein